MVDISPRLVEGNGLKFYVYYASSPGSLKITLA
jgi:hypothetical protein